MQLGSLEQHISSISASGRSYRPPNVFLVPIRHKFALFQPPKWRYLLTLLSTLARSPSTYGGATHGCSWAGSTGPDTKTRHWMTTLKLVPHFKVFFQKSFLQYRTSSILQKKLFSVKRAWDFHKSDEKFWLRYTVSGLIRLIVWSLSSDKNQDQISTHLTGLFCWQFVYKKIAIV